MYGAIQTQFAGELVMKSLQSAVNQRSEFPPAIHKRGSDVSRNILIYTSYIGAATEHDP